MNQNKQQLKNNSPYNIQIFNATVNTSISIKTLHNVINPTINGSSSQIIAQPADINTLSIRNGCPTDTGFFSYFDQI